MTLLQEWGVTAGAALNPRELFVDPHLRRRGFWEHTDDYSAGPNDYYGRGYQLSLTPFGTDKPTPKLGQHNRYLLSTLLGLDDGAIDEFEETGIVGDQPVLNEAGGMMRNRS